MTTDPAELFAEVTDAVAGVFALMDIAESEIAEAGRRHPDAADVLWHCFSLLCPADLRDGRLKTEDVYRAHCRELLERVAVGADTRPGTAAEVCCLMLETSQVAPLSSSLAGLYFRMWVAAGLPDVADIAEASSHHEALEASRIDEHEEFARRRLADATRVLGGIECKGIHHGEKADCRYAEALDDDPRSDV